LRIAKAEFKRRIILQYINLHPNRITALIGRQGFPYQSLQNWPSGFPHQLMRRHTKSPLFMYNDHCMYYKPYGHCNASLHWLAVRGFPTDHCKIGRRGLPHQLMRRHTKSSLYMCNDHFYA
jgi:hypothetical protein